jgi:GWxTD domain-containing protein
MKKTALFFGAVAAICSGIFGCASGSESAVECYFPAKYRLRSLPVFDSYIMTVKGKTGSRVDVYLLVPYSRIRFQKNGDGYRGSYSATCIIRDKDGQPILTREATRPLTSDSYENTASSRFDAFLQSFELAPGNYQCEVNLIDDGSGLRSTVQRKITVPDFQGSDVAAGDFLLLEHASADAGGVVLRPRFPSRLRSDDDSLGLFQEIYNLQSGDTLRLSFSYTMDRLFSESDRMVVRPLFGDLRNPDEKESDSCYYRRDSVCVIEKPGTMRVVQFFQQPWHGYNTFHRQIAVRRFGKETTIDQKHAWLVRRSLPGQMDPGALAYIITDEERDSLMLAGTSAETALRLSKFWEIHGGVAKRQEYEERVREANELFSYYTEGWRTPMGATYIVCGTPDYVECQGGMNEVWYYGAGNQVAAVTFRDDYHQDDEEPFYRIVPFSTNDFFWRSCVDRWRRR